MKPYLNRKGEEVEGAELQLHVQCRWRLLDSSRILFGSDDLLRPADQSTAIECFDWDQQDSMLDKLQRDWFAHHRAAPPKVIHVAGDVYGGCHITLEGERILELLPCDSDDAEHWRLLGAQRGGAHFVIQGRSVSE